MSESNGDGRVIVRLDMVSLCTLMAGGNVDLPMVNVRLQAGGDLARLIWDERRRLNRVRVQKPLPLKDS